MTAWRLLPMRCSGPGGLPRPMPWWPPTRSRRWRPAGGRCGTCRASKARLNSSRRRRRHWPPGGRAGSSCPTTTWCSPGRRCHGPRRHERRCRRRRRARAGFPPRAAALGPAAPGGGRRRRGARSAGRRRPAGPRLATARPVVAAPGRGDRDGPPVLPGTAWPKARLPWRAARPCHPQAGSTIWPRDTEDMSRTQSAGTVSGLTGERLAGGLGGRAFGESRDSPILVMRPSRTCRYIAACSSTSAPFGS